VAALFKFDPSITTDQIDPLNRIRVRWAFDYKQGSAVVWDIDTTEARASDIQEHQYSQPKTYTVALQAFNTYFPGPSAIVTRDLTVLPEHGRPRPPAPTVMIPAGTYPVGVTTVAGGNTAPYAENELVRDALNITLSANLYIDKFEVTNRYYVDFLEAATDSGIIAFDDVSAEISLIETGDVLITLDPDVTRIIYVDEETGFTVDNTARDLPVTGVTWIGAKTYCSFYGLRLPTEYEWEIAARLERIATTADNGYVYPWMPDNQINGGYANYRDSGDPYEERNNLRAETPVGSYSDIDSLMGSWPHENAEGPTGTYDQAGNVAEWVDDWYVPGIYNTMRTAVDQTGRWPVDPQSPKEAESPTHTHVVRGGSFFDTPAFLRLTRREARDPLVGGATVGFRAIYTEFNP
jgi:formylglycine-generating enzyme required for sulfatase activity